MPRSARSFRAALALALLVGCRDRPEPPPRSQPAQELVDLASLAPLRAEFNAHRGQSRFLTLLAPT